MASSTPTRPWTSPPRSRPATQRGKPAVTWRQPVIRPPGKPATEKVRAMAGFPSEQPQILALLPVGDVPQVAVELAALDRRVPVDDDLAQRRAQAVVVLQRRHGFAERSRQPVGVGAVGIVSRRA